MANERYVNQVQPSLGDKAWGTGNAVIKKGEEFVQHFDEAVDMAPPAASVWLAVIVGIAAYKLASSIGKNIGPRDGVARLVRGAAYVCAAWMAGNYAHDNFLESKGYAINGKQQTYEQIHSSPRAADFERASKPYKRSYDYAPYYSDETSASPARSHAAPTGSYAREAQNGVAAADRRHNKPIAQPQ